MDQYIATHLYGDARKTADTNETLNDSVVLGDVLGAAEKAANSFINLDGSMLKRRQAVASQTAGIQKMTAFSAYIALIKGYCGACVLFAPKAFANGGFIFSPVALVFAGWFSTICALKLIQSGQKLQCYSYSLIVRRAFGRRG